MGITDHIVIVGAGHAGVQLAASPREGGNVGPLTLVHGEDRRPYDRPSLSKNLLADDDAAPVPLRGEGFFASRDVDLVAARIDRADTDRGVLVDERLRTSDEAVSAIGDCAVVHDPTTGATSRLESIQNATDQARHLASGLLGESGGYRAVPWFWSTQGSLKLQIVGLVEGVDSIVDRGAGDRRSLLCFRDGRLIAVESINDPGTHLTARRLFERGLAAAEFDLRHVAKQMLAASGAVA